MKLRDALRILHQPAPAHGAELRIALVCGCTPLHLQTFLAAELRLQLPDRSIRVEPGLYGDCLGSLERVQGDAPDAAAVVLEWADLDPRLGIRHLGGWRPADVADALRSVELRLDALRTSLTALAARTRVALCLPTLPLPPLSHETGWQAGPVELELDRRVADFAAAVARSPTLQLVNRRRLDALSPPHERLDVQSELTAGFPYRLPHAAALAGLLARLVAAQPPKKGLVTDLDGVLWRGIVGECGAHEVAWDLDRHGHMHGLYQQLLASLAEAGVLIAVASRNDPAVVQEVFRRPDCVLPPAVVFPWEVHWGDKSESVARILAAWRVGADSVVFVDDSPLELAEVAAAHPGIEGLWFPDTDDGVYDLLVELRDRFGKASIGDEDRLRRESLRHATVADASVDPSARERLLAEAGAELAVEWTKDAADARALELLNKTNQFNLNGRRLSDGAWRAYLRDPATFLLVAAYRDKYGALGRIAVVAGRTNSHRIDVEHWVMSCRAFGRRIEHRCLDLLFDAFGVEEIAFDFAATQRNGPLREFLRDMLNGSPTPGCVLARGDFDARRPMLHHAITTSAPDA